MTIQDQHAQLLSELERLTHQNEALTKNCRTLVEHNLRHIKAKRDLLAIIVRFKQVLDDVQPYLDGQPGVKAAAINVINWSSAILTSLGQEDETQKGDLQ